MKYLWFILIFSTPVLAYDEDVSLNLGVGVFDSGKSSPSESKLLYAGYNDYFYHRLMYFRTELGGWNDLAGNGRSGSFFGAYLFGINIENQRWYGNAAGGVAIIGTPDTYLGGPVNFTEEIGFGVNGQHNSKLGLFYKHISNAGIYDPNIGRDFIGAQVTIPLF
jgi:hypothetical protein